MPLPKRADGGRQAGTAGTAGTAGLTPVLLLLGTAGWSANHFASLIPVLDHAFATGAGVLEGAFGVYALGLLPGLLGGGAVANRLGAGRVALLGLAVAALGNAAMALWHDPTGLYGGRLVVGIGVGLAISAGTALAADVAGRTGATSAGIVLTSGFAVGPVASGLLADLAPGNGSSAVVLPFLVAAILAVVVAGAVAPAVLRTGRPAEAHATPTAPTAPDVREAPGAGVRTALVAAVPMAVWVFACATLPMVVLVQQWSDTRAAPWLPGLAAVVTLGTGVVVQVVARRRGWGSGAGIGGALAAAAGLGLAGLGLAGDGELSVAAFVACALLLGTAYGLCLRDGLVDVERLAPADARAVTIGVFYVCTYLGFGLPVTLERLRGVTGVTAPLLALAALALLAAGHRWWWTRAARSSPAGVGARS